MCTHLHSEVLQVKSQHVCSDCDGSLSLVVLSRAQPRLNVLYAKQRLPLFSHSGATSQRAVNHKGKYSFNIKWSE